MLSRSLRASFSRRSFSSDKVAISRRAFSASFKAAVMLSSRSLNALRMGPQAMRRIKSKTTMNAIEAQITVPNAGLNSAPIGLSECYEQTNDHTEQRNTLDQSGSNDHV